MEDAATSEISRAQLWQWIHHRATLEDGRQVTPELFTRIEGEELAKIRELLGPERFETGQFPEARRLFDQLCLAPTLEEFLTIPAYEALVRAEQA
jgi:malate synthase